jgi:hypothetical protein
MTVGAALFLIFLTCFGCYLMASTQKIYKACGSDGFGAVVGFCSLGLGLFIFLTALAIGFRLLST